MATIFFDTHDYIHRLTESGISLDQAEAHSKALSDAMNDELAKKSDLNEFRAETKSNLNEFRAETKSNLNEFRAETKSKLNEFRTELNEFRAETRGQFELLKWMFGFTLAGTVSILFKIFH